MKYFTDIHGNRELFDEIMKFIGNDNFIYGGDAIDRGQNGYEIMKELITNPKCRYIMGNHEDMFCNAVAELKIAIANGDFDISKSIYSQMNVVWQYIEISQSIANGGIWTLQAFIDDGMPDDFVDMIHNLPIYTTYNKFDICHAGCQTKIFGGHSNHDETSMLWNRNHFNFSHTAGRIMLHGHTPINYMPPKYKCDYAPILYAGGTKINMDAGTYNTNQIFVMDLDSKEINRFVKTAAGVIRTKINMMDRSKKPYINNNM